MISNKQNILAFFRKMPPLSFAMALFYCGALFAALTAYDWHLCVPFLTALTAGVGLYILLTLWASTSRRVNMLAAVLVLCASLYALVFILQYRHLGWNDKIGFFTHIGTLLSTPFPALINPALTANAAATLLEGCLPLALGLVYDTRGWRRVIWCVAALLLAFVIMLSASRGAWVALFVTSSIAASWYICFQRQPSIPAIRIHIGPRPALAVSANRLSRWAMLGFVVLLGAVLGLKLLLTLFANTAARAIDRLDLYRDSFYLVLEFPFTGIGGGAVFAQMYSHFQLLIQVPYLEYAHNLWLSVWLAHGLVGLLGFCGLIIASLRLLWRALPQINATGFGAALGSLAILLHGLTDAPQYDSKWPVLLMTFALFALLIAASRMVNAKPLGWIDLRLSEVYRVSATGMYRPQRWPRRRIVLVGIAIFIALGWFLPGITALAASNIAAVAHAHAQLGPQLSDNERQHLLAQADDWLGRGQAIHPHSAAVLREHGMLAFERGNYAETIWFLTRAAPTYPDDQGLLKALGLAYTWYGYTEEGSRILGRLTRAEELRQELDVWSVAWSERGQQQYATNSRVVATLLNTQQR